MRRARLDPKSTRTKPILRTLERVTKMSPWYIGRVTKSLWSRSNLVLGYQLGEVSRALAYSTTHLSRMASLSVRRPSARHKRSLGFGLMRSVGMVSRMVVSKVGTSIEGESPKRGSRVRDLLLRDCFLVGVAGVGVTLAERARVFRDRDLPRIGAEG